MKGRERASEHSHLQGGVDQAVRGVVEIWSRLPSLAAVHGHTYKAGIRGGEPQHPKKGHEGKHHLHCYVNGTPELKQMTLTHLAKKMTSNNLHCWSEISVFNVTVRSWFINCGRHLFYRFHHAVLNQNCFAFSYFSIASDLVFNAELFLGILNISFK